MSKHKTLTQKQFTIPSLVRHIVLSWLLAVVTEYLILPNELRDLAELDGLAQMSFVRVIGITCGIAVLLTVISCFIKTQTVERWCIVISFAVLSITALWVSATWAFFAVCGFVLVILIVFGIYGWDKSKESITEPKKAHRAYPWITAGLSVVFFLFVSAWTVGRVYSFSSPTYDFGIFSQMFYHMKESGLPMTTVERDGLLSHFAVHVSPIYYLMLPFYWLAPIPATLQVLQAATITSAVIPLWKIGKHHGLTGVQRMLVCAVLLLYPAFSGGTSYDIHENCFLTPLILWLLYGIDRKNAVITAIAAVLTLMVKEDAAVYVAVVALWLIVKTVLRLKKLDVQNLITGISLLAISLGWFFLVTGYLAKSGDGVMTYRYNNFMYDGSSSLITVIKSVILNPMKAVYECVDAEKLYFIAMTLLPLLGLPLLTRRYERYILLIPYILVNLMSDYQYQHDIFFQYTFGSNAFLMYLTVVNLVDLKINWHRTFVVSAATIVSIVCFATVVVPKAIHYPIQAIQYDFSNSNSYKSTSLSLLEAKAIVNWVYHAYSTPQDRENATIEMLPEFNRELGVGSLAFAHGIIYQSHSIDICLIDSFDRFVSTIKTIQSPNHTLYYRGHSNSNYTLLPSIMRKTSWLEHECDMYNETIIECPDAFQKCSTHLDYLVEMQHYGLPTRLLDVTKNPLVALYFACIDNNNTQGEFIVFDVDNELVKYPKSDTVSVLSSLPLFKQTMKDDILAWATDPTITDFSFNLKATRLLHEIKLEKPAFKDEIRKTDITSCFFVQAEKKNARIIKQDGAFIICGLFSRNTNVINQHRYKESGKVQVYIITQDGKEDIITQLNRMSINRAHLFPEIQDVTAHIKNRY